jgi:hypothetical protein
VETQALDETVLTFHVGLEELLRTETFYKTLLQRKMRRRAFERCFFYKGKAQLFGEHWLHSLL